MRRWYLEQEQRQRRLRRRSNQLELLRQSCLMLSDTHMATQQIEFHGEEEKSRGGEGISPLLLLPYTPNDNRLVIIRLGGHTTGGGVVEDSTRQMGATTRSDLMHEWQKAFLLGYAEIFGSFGHASTSVPPLHSAKNHWTPVNLGQLQPTARACLKNGPLQPQVLLASRVHF